MIQEPWSENEIAAMASRIKRFGWPYVKNAEAVVRQILVEQERLRPARTTEERG